MYILIDFDGTCVKHQFPGIGEDIGAIPVLEDLIKNGHNLILFTMRCNHDKMTTGNTPGIEMIMGDFLTEAIEWFKLNNLPLYGIQTHPTQSSWTTSPKAYGHMMIDDSALGCPLIYPEEGKPYVDWIAVRKMLVEQKIIN